MKRSPLSLSLSFPPLLLHSSIKTKITQIGRRADYHSFNQQQANKKKKEKGDGKMTEQGPRWNLARTLPLSLSPRNRNKREEEANAMENQKGKKVKRKRNSKKKTEKISSFKQRTLFFSLFSSPLSLSLAVKASKANHYSFRPHLFFHGFVLVVRLSFRAVWFVLMVILRRRDDGRFDVLN